MIKHDHIRGKRKRMIKQKYDCKSWVTTGELFTALVSMQVNMQTRTFQMIPCLLLLLHMLVNNTCQFWFSLESKLFLSDIT